MGSEEEMESTHNNPHRRRISPPNHSSTVLTIDGD
jgi:hypothetical protein